MPRRIAAGNWKMNGTEAALSEAKAIADAVPDGIVALLCPPATLLGAMAREVEGSALRLGGQTCHPAASGAHTGDVSAEMLFAAGATHCIVGHSERRADHGESDADVRARAEAVWRAGMTAVVCVGETLEEREAGRTLDVVRGQLDGSLADGASAGDTIVAYEPVWAIGTGKVATPDQVAEVHDAIRAHLGARFSDSADWSLLYGGSVKASNAAELFSLENVDGGLVGGASLKAEDFVPIMQALARA